MLKFRSDCSMVIAPASIGNENRRRLAVTEIAYTNSGSLCSDIPRFRMLSTAV